jgi:hypothetical protein
MSAGCARSPSWGTPATEIQYVHTPEAPAEETHCLRLAATEIHSTATFATEDWPTGTHLVGRSYWNCSGYTGFKGNNEGAICIRQRQRRRLESLLLYEFRASVALASSSLTSSHSHKVGIIITRVQWSLVTWCSNSAIGPRQSKDIRSQYAFVSLTFLTRW